MAKQDPHQRRLAGAIRPEQAEDPPGSRFDTHLVDRDQVAEALANFPRYKHQLARASEPIGSQGGSSTGSAA